MPVQIQSVGVLSSRRSNVFEILKTWFVKPVLMTGYLIDFDEAVAALELNRPEAATWWKANTPHMRNSQLVFETKVCRYMQ